MKFNLTSLIQAASKITEGGFSRELSDPVYGGMDGGVRYEEDDIKTG